MAGVIACEYVIQADEPIFDIIVLYGVCMNLRQKKCTVHKLVMNFKTHESKLYNSEEELTINDGINRLLVTLDTSDHHC